MCTMPMRGAASAPSNRWHLKRQWRREVAPDDIFGANSVPRHRCGSYYELRGWLRARRQYALSRRRLARSFAPESLLCTPSRIPHPLTATRGCRVRMARLAHAVLTYAFHPHVPALIRRAGRFSRHRQRHAGTHRHYVAFGGCIPHEARTLVHSPFSPARGRPGLARMFSDTDLRWALKLRSLMLAFQGQGFEASVPRSAACMPTWALSVRSFYGRTLRLITRPSVVTHCFMFVTFPARGSTDRAVHRMRAAAASVGRHTDVRAAR